MIKNKILTKKAFKIINKRLSHKKLTQQDSNYLSRFVRPKLRAIALINAEYLLKKLNYNPKAPSIERKIKNLILNNVNKVDSIIICGSAIQNNYENYRDIDVIVATKDRITKNLKENNALISKIEEEGRKENIELDIQIYSKKAILSQYSHNPSLIYQLKDYKVIYGNLILPSKISLSNLDLKMKLDWSEGLDSYSETNEIYLAIRNAMLILLLMNKTIDNYKLNQNLITLLGFDLFNKLKDNRASKIEKKLVLTYLNLLTKYLEDELNKPKWERIEILNL